MFRNKACYTGHTKGLCNIATDFTQIQRKSPKSFSLEWSNSVPTTAPALAPATPPAVTPAHDPNRRKGFFGLGSDTSTIGAIGPSDAGRVQGNPSPAVITAVTRGGHPRPDDRQRPARVAAAGACWASPDRSAPLARKRPRGAAARRPPAALGGTGPVR